MLYSIKLTHHHNIQRSTLRLRELSKPRENTPQHPGSDDPTRPAHAHGDYARLTMMFFIHVACSLTLDKYLRFPSVMTLDQ